MNLLSLPARIYVWIIGLIGSAVAISNLLRWESMDLIRFACFLLVALFAAGLRVGVSNGNGSAMPINILFVLIGIMELSLPETIVIAAATTAIQCLQVLKGPSRNFLTFFNVSNIATATWIAHLVYFHPQLNFDIARSETRAPLSLPPLKNGVKQGFREACFAPDERPAYEEAGASCKDRGCGIGNQESEVTAKKYFNKLTEGGLTC